jgi:hypothetical protein
VRNAYRILTGKPGERKTFATPRHKWEDSIRMDFAELLLACAD